MDRWIDLVKIPRKNGVGKHKNKQVIDWNNCRNIIVDFKYGEINGKIKIIGKADENNILIEYNNEDFLIHHHSLEQCRLGRILKIINNTNKNKEKQKEDRLGLVRTNNQGCLMKIIEYKNTKNIIVEFQDLHHYKVKCNWNNFINGSVENPYHPSIFNVGIVGECCIKKDGIYTKEYQAWHDMLKRCFSRNLKEKRPTYKDVTCCKEWLYFDNFQKWLRSQSNYEKWLYGDKWAVDKDILIKGNKIYSPNTCCLVSPEINSLFTKRQNYRGDLPIGVTKYKNKYSAQCNIGIGNSIHLGYYIDKHEAFAVYKKEKEKHVKRIAEESFKNMEITSECYQAMMNYEVEIDD